MQSRWKDYVLCVAIASLAAVTYCHAQFHLPGAKHDKQEKKMHSDLEWMWQYGPPPGEGRENQLIQDPRFYPFLKQNLIAPQSFWGVQGTKYKPLADTAMDFLSVPGKVIAENDRYLTVTGCVFHFCPSRGLLWIDLNAALKGAPGPANLVVFGAIDWIRDSKTTSQPDAEYTLWVFPNRHLDTNVESPDHIPAALVRSISRWTKEPMAGSGIVENLTHAIVVDPDGTPHEMPISALGVTTPKMNSERESQ